MPPLSLCKHINEYTGKLNLQITYTTHKAQPSINHELKLQRPQSVSSLCMFVPWFSSWNVGNKSIPKLGYSRSHETVKHLCGVFEIICYQSSCCNPISVLAEFGARSWFPRIYSRFPVTSERVVMSAKKTNFMSNRIWSNVKFLSWQFIVGRPASQPTSAMTVPGHGRPGPELDVRTDSTFRCSINDEAWCESNEIRRRERLSRRDRSVVWGERETLDELIPLHRSLNF